MSLYSTHPDFKVLAARITVSNLHKNTLDNFSDKIELMYNYASNGQINYLLLNIYIILSKKIRAL